MSSRFMNIISPVVGCLLAIFSVRLLMQHQYVFVHRRALTEDPKVLVPTIAPLFLAIWLLVFGVVGLIDEMRRAKSKSN
jgi:hypothetical protein